VISGWPMLALNIGLVLGGVALFIYGITLSASHGRPSAFRGPFMRGVDPEAEAKVTSLNTNILAGTFDLSGRGVIVGSGLAEQLEIMVGDRITIYAPGDLKHLKDARDNQSDHVRVPDDYEVRGVFESGWYEFDSNFILVSLENSQSLYELADHVHGLSIAVDDPLKADQYGRRLSESLSLDLRVTSWMQENPMMVAVMVEKNLMLYILFFIVLVAAFGITCTTITFVVMKTGDVGLMRALGATSQQVMKVFLTQSLIVSFFGILCGTGAGLVAIHYRNEFLAFMRKLTGFELFPDSVYGLSQLPALVLPGDLAVICGGSLIICLLAAVLPAWHASKLKPVEALRHE
jgi:lipoprotein-releasing system permease protein